MAERITAQEVQRLGAAGVAARVRKLVHGVGHVAEEVESIVAYVEVAGDHAVLDLVNQLDLDRGRPDDSDDFRDEAWIASESLDLSSGLPRPLLVSAAELDEAIRAMPREVVAGLQVTIANVAEVASAAVGLDAETRLPQGHTVALRELPLDSAAVYVPGGRAPYPSTAVMGVVTARAAGVLDVSVCSPPRRDGEIDPLVLGTCRLLGVQRVYRMGGAHAIAALACGTKTVQRVDVIVGPGNLYVQEAKRQLSHVVAIDGIAGPSDLVVAFGADADVSLVALDLLAQAEHGEGSLVVAISPSADALAALERELERLRERVRTERPAVERAAWAGVCSGDAQTAVRIADAIAPEHLQLIGAEVEALSSNVRHAGCLFVGASSATAFGDYVAGSNHILPTGGAARFSSVLNPACFRRRMTEVRIDPGSARTLAAAGAPIARAEGFELHARSMEARAAAPQDAEGREQGPSAPGAAIGENQAR
jgi:histidinol dehydrogenase